MDEREERDADLEAREDAEAFPVEVAGHKLKCPVCENDRFWSRSTLMNTRGLTFFNFDFLNREADNYICSRCNYIYWFLKR